MSKKYLMLAGWLLCSHAYASDLHAAKYATVQNFMKKLEREHADVVRLVNIGQADSGQTIQALAIGNGAIHNLVVATHHGNEYGSSEVGMALASSLAEQPIVDQTVYVIPVLNIEGYNANERQEKDAKGHYRDPNRDYPGPCGTEGPYHLKSTAALAKFIDSENIISTATLHTYSPAVVYPWGISTSDVTPPNVETFISMAKQATEFSKYKTGTSTEVIYPADGTYEDYIFWKTGAWSLLFELGYSHSPSPAQVKEMIKVNIPGIRKMLEQAPHERALTHEFTGQCDKRRMAGLDKHDE